MMSFQKFYEEALAIVGARSFSVDVEVWCHARDREEDRRPEISFKAWVQGVVDGRRGESFDGPTPEAVLDALKRHVEIGVPLQHLADLGEPSLNEKLADLGDHLRSSPVAPFPAPETPPVAAHADDEMPF